MGKKVECFDLDDNYIKTYDSYQQAANELGCDESTIRRSAKFGRIALGKYWFIDEDKEELLKGTYELANSEEPEIKKPKVLLLDIETAPLRVYSWGVWKQNINPIQLICNWYILCWSAKWLGEEDVISFRLSGEESLYENDSRIIAELWKVLDDADVVIAHNGSAFDIPKINTRFVFHGLMPPSPYKQIDTLNVAKQNFSFTYNSLDYIAGLLGCRRKKPTDFTLWHECLIGNEKALSYMSEYCDEDIIVLEDVYLKLRPYIKGHPNLDLYHDTDTITCPHCSNETIERVSGKYFYTQAVRYPLYRCNHCGSLSRAKQGEKYINKKQISAIPK